MKRFLVLVLIAAGCTSKSSKHVGLWQIEEVLVDAIPRSYNPILVEIKPNHSFAVSRVSGDLVGLYKYNSEALYLSSSDGGWFNTSWNVHIFDQYMDLTGMKQGYRTTKLRFRKIDEVPDFQEFENRIVGHWNLYKIWRKEEVEKLTNTWFSIEEGGGYSIGNEGQVLESGRVTIDTRHRKIIFEQDQTAWSVWFYGDEMRLSSEKDDVMYSLRKVDERSHH